jgi:hydrogenase expression/formation protein HypC
LLGETGFVMCLGIPMKIVELEGQEAVAEAGGIRKRIRLDLLDNVQMGDFVLIHTGYAIEKLDPDEALETLELIKQVYRAGMTGETEEPVS